MTTALQFNLVEIAGARMSRFKGTKKGDALYGGSVRRAEAEAAWTGCYRLGGAFRILDGRTYRALTGPDAIPAGPGACFGTFSQEKYIRIYDVTEEIDGPLVQKTRITESAYARYDAIQRAAGRRL